MQKFSTLLFAIAVLHTFLVKRFDHWSHQLPQGHVLKTPLHLLSEVELVFAFWGGLYLFCLGVSQGATVAWMQVSQLSFVEPFFVFVLMMIASTRPILDLAQKGLLVVADQVPFSTEKSFVFLVLSVGALLGSFITEPAAMTVTFDKPEGTVLWPA